MKTVIQNKLSEPAKLPSIAKNIHVLMQALASDKLSYQQLAEVVKHYPEITARLIFLANSSWSAPVSPINNIEQACARLGMSIVKSISIAISISSSFDTRSCPLFDTVHFWTSSMLVAEGAGLLASKLSQTIATTELEHTAQTAGVLHNLGLLWLADNFPAETNTALQILLDDTNTLSLRESLKQTIETDYCEIGSWIAKQLALPEVLVTAMEHHLNPDYQDSSSEIAHIVGGAAEMVSALHKQSEEFTSIPGLETLEIDSASQQLVFQQLAKNFEKTQQLAQTLFKG